MVDIGSSFAKYIVFILNFLFAVSSIKVQIETQSHSLDILFAVNRSRYGSSWNYTQNQID